MSQDFLLGELTRRKKKNPSYSLRSFARDLGISPGHLSGLMNGKKPLTVRQATVIAGKLQLSPAQRSKLLKALAPALRDEEWTADQLRPLREDEFRLISDWYHIAILNLVRLGKVTGGAKELAERLGISEVQALEAVERLERLRFIVCDGDQMRRSAKPLRTSHDVPSRAIRNYHRQNLELAQRKLETVPLELRTFSSMTMPVNLSKLPVVKEMIEKFKDQVSAELEEGDKQDVYTFSLQLFPVTQHRR
jgi:uncharacterized protein (TIGR02147 family)